MEELGKERRIRSGIRKQEEEEGDVSRGEGREEKGKWGGKGGKIGETFLRKNPGYGVYCEMCKLRLLACMLHVDRMSRYPKLQKFSTLSPTNSSYSQSQIGGSGILHWLPHSEKWGMSQDSINKAVLKSPKRLVLRLVVDTSHIGWNEVLVTFWYLMYKSTFLDN